MARASVCRLAIIMCATSLLKSFSFNLGVLPLGCGAGFAYGNSTTDCGVAVSELYVCVLFFER